MAHMSSVSGSRLVFPLRSSLHREQRLDPPPWRSSDIIPHCRKTSTPTAGIFRRRRRSSSHIRPGLCVTGNGHRRADNVTQIMRFVFSCDRAIPRSHPSAAAVHSKSWERGGKRRRDREGGSRDARRSRPATVISREPA